MLRLQTQNTMSPQHHRGCMEVVHKVVMVNSKSGSVVKVLSKNNETNLFHVQMLLSRYLETAVFKSCMITWIHLVTIYHKLTVYSHRWRASQLGMIWITLYINSLVVFWIWHALLFVADCSDRIWLTHDLPWLAPFPSQCLKVQGFPSIRKQCQHQLWKVAPILDGNQRQSNLPHTNLALTHHHFRKTANIFIRAIYLKPAQFSLVPVWTLAPTRWRHLRKLAKFLLHHQD